MDGTGKLALEQQEVIGNTFTLLFAGHESTACGLAAALGFLAIHQEEQQTVYEEILKQIPASKDPFPHLLACFHESLGMYSAAAFLTWEITEDVTVKVARPAEKEIVFKKGALMILNMIAVQHNPHFFPEPEEYRPSEWYGAAETDVLMFDAHLTNV
ncbi:cytochrome P450 [Mycena rosella]|uniref:Cytochrome P450 n=1 Tax=Mycena rosella TaxID=1033263 RepID=A0AAD7GAN2_MYCRO|nr:cytochrome P450 [Mycena rosella]